MLDYILYTLLLGPTHISVRVYYGGKLPLYKTFDLPHKGVQKIPMLYQLLLHLHL